MDDKTKKKCSKCNIIKDISDFNKGRNQCKECIRKLKKDNYENNKYKNKLLIDEEYENNKYKLKKCIKCGMDKLGQDFPKGKDTCKSCQSIYLKQYRKNNEEILKYKSKLQKEKRNKNYDENKYKLKKCIKCGMDKLGKDFTRKGIGINICSSCRKNKKETITEEKKILNKIKSNLGCRMRQAIKSGLGFKLGRSKELLGCEWEVVVKHLESLFQYGMSWDNYGKKGWEIDHIKPCNSFNLIDPIEQKVCFNFINLQPLWSIENNIKSDKWDNTSLFCSKHEEKLEQLREQLKQKKL